MLLIGKDDAFFLQIALIKTEQNRCKMKRRVLVVGAGAIGINAALILDKLGHEAILVHDKPDIFDGSAANTAFIWHKTGQEYCHPYHQQTGELCVKGEITQRLFFPMDFLETAICTGGHVNPVQFFVSKESSVNPKLVHGHVPVERFQENTKHMRAYFAVLFQKVKDAYPDKTDEEIEKMLGCTPERFSRPIHNLKEESPHVNAENIAVGNFAAGDGINMPHLYALYKSAVRESKIQTEFNTTVEKVKRVDGVKGYCITLKNGKQVEVDDIILAASYGNPELIGKIPDAKPSMRGTYCLNTMLHVILPEALSEQAAHISFVLQAENGGALTCIDREARKYVIYIPHEGGSQVAKYLYDPLDPKFCPQEWYELLEHGLDTDNLDHNFRIQTILQDAARYYPVLNSPEVEVVDAPCRVVFNADSKDSVDGTDRRVRAMRYDAVACNVFVVHGPKLTNSCLTAFETVEAMLTAAGLPSLAGEHKLGKLESEGVLDITHILALSQKFNWHNQKASVEDAFAYAEKYGLPKTMIRTDASRFHIEKKEQSLLTVRDFLDSAGKGDIDRMKQYLAQSGCRVDDECDLYTGVTNCLEHRDKQGALLFKGARALHIAAQNGQVYAMSWLIKECGATIDIQTKEGWTPLHAALTQGQAPAAELLLSNGARPDIKDGKGRTPIAILQEMVRDRRYLIHQQIGMVKVAQLLEINIPDYLLEQVKAQRQYRILVGNGKPRKVEEPQTLRC